MDGSPFFVVTCSVDAGLIKVLREEIILRLKADVPGQPSEAALAENPLLSRFTLVFDREGYSPDFFAELKKDRIAVLTYRKFPGEDGPEEEFEPQEVTLVQGEKVTMKLAERGVCLSNGLWMREGRRLNEKSHQSSILSSDYGSDLTRVAPKTFARWRQENFFKYMRQNFG